MLITQRREYGKMVLIARIRVQPIKKELVHFQPIKGEAIVLQEANEIGALK